MMREPKADLHRPVAALRRLQHLVGHAMAVNHDRNPNRHAQVTSVLQEAFDVAFCALNGGPLPELRSHSKAH